MTLDSAEFKARVEAFNDVWAAINLLHKPVVAYDAKIGGVDVIIVGVPEDPANPLKSIAPLLVLWSPELDALIEINATKVLSEGG